MGDDEKVREWLPEGWIVKVNRRPNGKVDRLYVSPVSGRTFRSRVEVMRHLNIEKAGSLPPVTMTFSEEVKSCETECPEEDKLYDGEYVKDSPVWLPSGWIMELKTQKSGRNAGRKYKCYIDPLTRSSFYSKIQVLRYLETGKRFNSTSKKEKFTVAEPKEEHLRHSPSNCERANGDSEVNISIKDKPTNLEHEEENLCNSSSRKHFNPDLKGNIVSLIETSPDGLPPGWIKEVKCRKNASGFRRDAYYIDPISGYAFVSKKDAFRYIESGEISRYAFKPRTKVCADKMFLDHESPIPISVKRLKEEGEEANIQMCLFTGKRPKSNKKKGKECNQLYTEDSCPPPADQALHQCVRDAGPSYSTPTSTYGFEDANTFNLHENDMPEKPLEAAEVAALDQVIEKLLNSVKKTSPALSTSRLSVPVLQIPSGTDWSKDACIETQKPADQEILIQSFEPVDKSVEPPPKKHLEFEAAKKDMPSNETVNQVDAACDKSVKPSNEKPQGTKGDQKPDMAALVSSSSTNVHKNHVPEEMKNDIEEPVGFADASQRPKSRAKSQKNTAPVARRASKRLAGVEADPAAAIEVSDKSLSRTKKSRPNSGIIPPDDNDLGTGPSLPTNELLGKQVTAEAPKLGSEALGGEAAGLEELGGGVGSANEEPMSSPFGDSWPDPCIEFAFKTLTGEIPVLDTVTIEDYYLHGQLHSLSPDAPRSSTADIRPNGQPQPAARMQVNSTGSPVSSPGSNSMSPGKVKRLCRRAISRKIPASGK